MRGIDLADPWLDRKELNNLLNLLGDQPLSIELVAPHLKEMAPREIADNFSALLGKFTGEAGVERNRTLLASLEFSTRRLSEAARAALPWLGLFRGGVFEQVLLDVSQLDPAEWEAARSEFEATALIDVEREVLLNDRPYLRFHPTLAHAAAAGELLSGEEFRRRFVDIYGAVGAGVRRAFFGPNPRGGMEVMAREEANLRTAVTWALAAGDYDKASDLGGTFRVFLERAGRLRERDAWVTWLVAEVGKGGFTEAFVTQEGEAAMTLFAQGRAGEAIAKLEDLLAQLRATRAFEPAFQIAITQSYLGRLLTECGLTARAIPALNEAVEEWESLDEAAALENSATLQWNLSAALSDLANALRAAGRHEEALAAAERGLAINRKFGRHREVAAGHVLIARIYAAEGRFQEAEERYEEALKAARAAGDLELEAAALQNHGILADDRGQLARAATLYRRALRLFQEMEDEAAIMLTCNLLGVVEDRAGRWREARAW